MDRIILCGGNGAGKSTLGRSLAERLGYVFLDVEDFYFPHRDPGEPYQSARSSEEVSALLLEALQRSEACILAAVRGNYGAEVEKMFTRGIFLSVPKELRMERIRRRSFEKFGARMLPGGDLHQSEEAFFTMVEGRTEKDVENWLNSLHIPVLHADGTRPIQENVEYLAALLRP